MTDVSRVPVWQRTRITMLLVTHDLDEAQYLSDRVFVMSAQPALLAEVRSATLPRPRDRRDPEAGPAARSLDGSLARRRRAGLSRARRLSMTNTDPLST